MEVNKIFFTTLLLTGIFLSVNGQVGYEKSIELGGAIGLDKFTKGSFEIDMINGYRFNDCFSLGVGTGFRYTDALYYTSNTLDYYFESRDGKFLIPLYARVKANLTKAKVSPFFLANVGYTFDVGQNPNKNTYGLMIEPSFGVDFKLNEKNLGFYFLVGFNMQKAEYTYFRKTDEEKIQGVAGSATFKGGIKF